MSQYENHSSVLTGVGETNTPPDKKTGWKISFESTKSRAGLQFLLPGPMAKAQVKGVFLSQKPASVLFVRVITIIISYPQF